MALATPNGEGAIGVIRLSGGKAISICDDVFFGKNLGKQDTHTAHFGTVRDEEGRIVDEVLITIFKNPKSYTGEDVCEVSCHGSPFIIKELIQLFVRKGARLARKGEFTLRAFLNGKMDLSQAEAVADLIASHSESSHDMAMKQMRGGVSDEIAHLRQELIDFAALIELELDFGEEDVEFADRTALRNLVQKIQGLIRALIDSFRLGNAIKEGISTVIAGRPNAGKSTLLNALLNEDRAIVSEIAGTTRDTIEETLNINGVTFRLIDTAGIRDASDKIEAIGVRKTMEKIQQSALLIYVFDVVETSPEEVAEDIRKIKRDEVSILAVANKMDLNPYTKAESFVSELLPLGQIITASALNNMNVEYLKERLYQSVLEGKADASSTLISNARHYEALQKSNESLNDVLTGLDQGITQDFIAMDIRRSLTFLGEITGEISTDDLLDSIFSRFCIGK